LRRPSPWLKLGFGKRKPGRDAMSAAWPDIPYEKWHETCSALHLYSQIVGKYRLARTPWVNHAWHATLYVDARGLTTSLIPDAAGIEIAFDLRGHALRGNAADGRTAEFPLGPMSVAEFHGRFLEIIASLGGTPRFHGRPNERPDPIPFRDDRQTRPYDAEAVERFSRALVAIAEVFSRFRTGYIGKVSPVHLFWGSFDLAVTRFSGRPAPLHPGGVPGLPDEVTREAYSHEVSSAGFWPGDTQTKFPAFYSYAYPAPKGFSESSTAPGGAYFDRKLGEFVLPYEVVRTSSDPETTLMSFLESTYRAAADFGRWDRDALECPIGTPLRPRPLRR
jgi:hypothetical protein